MKKSLYFLLPLLAPFFTSSISMAQSYPSKPIRFIVGYPAGTSSDLGGRLIGERMGKRLGQPIIVENRVGANGTIGTKYVASSEPDGYTLIFGNMVTVHPIFIKTNAVDAAQELATVSNIYSQPLILYTSAKLPVNSLQELIDYAKANPPNKLNFASAAAAYDLIMQLLKSKLGSITYTVIPYAGSPAVVNALLSGEADLTVGVVSPFPPHVQSRRIRALLNTSAKRSSMLPDVPTARELGILNFEVAFNTGLWAPRGTNRDIVQKLSREASVAVKDAEVVEQFRKLGQEPVGSSPEEQLRTFDAEIKLWREAGRIANFQPQ